MAFTQPQPPKPQTPDPFASMGGGVQINGGWVPKGMASGGQIVQHAAPGAPAPAPAPGGAPSGVPGAPQTTQQTLNQPTTVGQQTPQGQPGTVTGAFQQALVNRLAPAPISAQSAEIAPAIQANRLAEQRGMERQRALLAERAAAGRFSDSGSFDTQLLGLGENRTQREGAFEGELTRGLGQQRAQELTSALMLGGGLLGDQDRMGLQRELAELQGQLQREGTAAQTSLGRRDLDIRDKLGSGQLNLGLLSSLLQNQQFGQGLGAQTGMFSAGLNQQALMQLLGQL